MRHDYAAVKCVSTTLARSLRHVDSLSTIYLFLYIAVPPSIDTNHLPLSAHTIFLKPRAIMVLVGGPVLSASSTPSCCSAAIALNLKPLRLEPCLCVVLQLRADSCSACSSVYVSSFAFGFALWPLPIGILQLSRSARRASRICIWWTLAPWNRYHQTTRS